MDKNTMIAWWYSVKEENYYIFVPSFCILSLGKRKSIRKIPRIGQAAYFPVAGGIVLEESQSSTLLKL